MSSYSLISELEFPKLYQHYNHERSPFLKPSKLTLAECGGAVDVDGGDGSSGEDACDGGCTICDKKEEKGTIHK